MIGLKKLDIYILKKFLLLFAAAFLICIFVFVMQAAWKYVNDLIGKGLSLEILGEFFGYIILYLMPQALPLAILLASLITFGNMGENFELLAMKAAGIPLFRIMRPLFLFALLMVGASFWFQNHISAPAYLNMRTLLFSMKLQSPAVEIPEGVFYNGVPNINIYVQKKDLATGMLYQTIIYKTDQGFDKAQIVLADSARLEMTQDKKNLVLDMWSGEQFESLESSAGARMMQSGAEAPYDRETFDYKQFVIDFDSNFNMLEKSTIMGMAEGKNQEQLIHSIDSMSLAMDSVGKQYYEDARKMYFRTQALAKNDSVELYKKLAKHPQNIDTLFAHLSPERQQMASQAARINIQTAKADLEWKAMTTSDTDKNIRRHWTYWHMVYTNAIACLFFFLIGAPLGAIIRKGGLGFPVLISVGVFIIKYVIDISTTKMAREGTLNMEFAMWLSTAIVAPLSIFLTYKATIDSGLFNMEAYLGAMRRLLGLRTKRHIASKEVIIHDPDMTIVPELISSIRERSAKYSETQHLLKAPSYVETFFRHKEDTEVAEISEQIEQLVEELSNSRKMAVIRSINRLPILYTTAHLSPFHSDRWNKFAGVFFPVGIVLWLRIWRFRLILRRELRLIVKSCDSLSKALNGENVVEEDETPNVPTEKQIRRRKIKKWIFIFLLVTLISAFAGNYGWNQWKRYRMRKMLKTEQTSDKQATEKPMLQQSGNALQMDNTLPDAPFTKGK